jgi:hypothetical protein
VARAVLLRAAVVMIAANMRDDQEPDAATINATWAEQGFGWRMVRLQ